MITIDNVSKIYKTSNGSVEALKNCTLHVSRGEICGVIGLSGAGKSTLVRLINYLEKPDNGTVTVNNNDLSALSKKELLAARRKIGMIFQHFNLLSSVTVFDNIAAPLRNIKTSPAETEKKVKELLELVGLTDKIYAYPSQLSGGQKQRVAIARALSCEPNILLCDEATSALDPDTTKQILALIKDISKKLTLTVVVIAHQMEVIKAICDKVAVMEGGLIVEYGEIVNIFSNPQSDITRRFISQSDSELYYAYGCRALYKLTFVGNRAEAPIIAQMINKYQVMPNILSGQIQRLGDTSFGTLVLDIEGENTAQAVEALINQGIGVEIINPLQKGEIKHA